MPLPIVVVVGAVLVSLLRGGRFRRMANAELRGAWLLAVGLALQILVDVASARLWLPEGLPSYLLLLASQLLVVGWAWLNRFHPGLPLIGLGLLLNAIVIGANGAMPVDPEAIRALGAEGAVVVPPGKHELMTAATRLPWLADVLALPPLRTIVSVGDIVLAAGLVPLVHHLMTYRTPAERRGGHRRDPDGASVQPEQRPGRTS